MEYVMGMYLFIWYKLFVEKFNKLKLFGLMGIKWIKNWYCIILGLFLLRKNIYCRWFNLKLNINID